MLMKRILAFAVIAVMTLGTLSGCGGGSNPNKADASGTAVSSGTTGANGADMVGNMYKQGLPVVKDKVTLKMYSTKDPRMLDFNQMEFFKNLEKKTNVHIEWDFEDNAAGGQKKNLILASGQYPDAFFMGITTSDVAKYQKDGIFIQLDKLIDLYGGNIKAAFEEKPLYKKLCTYVDGHIYSLGSSGEDEGQYNPDQLFIYKPWLDKLGLPVPTTMDEFYNTLKAFKEKDPNGNGKADEIPFSFMNGNTVRGIHSLFAAFGRSDIVSNDKTPDPRDHFVVEDGKVVFTADKPEFKNAVIYLHKFFADGLFDKEGFTQDVKQYFAKGKTDPVTLGSFMLWNAENMTGPDRAKDYAPVTPLKGPDGKQLWTKYNMNSGQITGATFAITKSCKNPEIVMRWVDQLYDKKTSAEGVYGPIGLMFKEGANGILEYNQIPQGLSFDEFRYKNCPVWPPSACFAEDYGKVLQYPPVFQKKVNIKKQYYDPYLKSETLPQLVFTADEIDLNNSIGNDIQNYVNSKRSAWLLNGGIEKEWDEYLAKLKQLKLDEYVKEMQAAYDRFSKN